MHLTENIQEIWNMHENSINTTTNNTLSCFLTGFILKFPIWGDPADDNCFDDEAYWEVRAPLFH